MGLTMCIHYKKYFINLHDFQGLEITNTSMSSQTVKTLVLQRKNQEEVNQNKKYLDC